MPDRRALMERADRLWRLVVWLRWMPANGLLVYDEHAAWSHDRKQEFDAWARDQVGARTYDRMARIYRGPLGSKVDMAVTIRQLKRALAAVREGKTRPTWG